MSNRDRALEIVRSLRGRHPGEQLEEARRACAEDGDLLDEVLSELERTLSIREPRRADEQIGLGNESDLPTERTDHPPRYDIGPCIGTGGFGVVHLATQLIPVRREVALKILHDDSFSRSLVRRFTAEQQVLALLEHPSIARIYDAGVLPDGRPFFSMELVRGQVITRYCDEERLPIDARLALMAQTCEAVLHAHQRGVLHRDLKPSNVLVTEIDGQPLAKVIDFGIAVATDARLAGTLERGDGSFAGTPMYASPEQASPDAYLDVRTDVFALGLLLYELVTGLTPRDPQQIRGQSSAEITRTLRTDSIAEPARRFVELPPDTRSATARARRLEPTKLERRLRGDLGHVMRRCLAMERGDRYPTVSDLLADLRRLLAGDVPIAAPTTIGRSVRLLRRRHPIVAPTAAVVASALPLILAGGFLWEMGHRDLLQAEKRRALQADIEQRDDQMQALEAEVAVLRDGILGTLTRSIEEDLGARVSDVLVEQSELARTDWSDRLPPTTKIELLAAGATAERRLGRAADAAETFAESIQMARTTLGPGHPRTLELRVAELSALSVAETLDDRIAEFDAIIERQSQALGAEDEATLGSRSELAEALRLRGSYEAALAEHEAVLTVRSRLAAESDPNRLISLQNLALTRRQLANDLANVDPERSLATLRRAIAEFNDVLRLGRSDPDRAAFRLVLNHGNYGDANAEMVRLVERGQLAAPESEVAMARSLAREQLEYAYELAVESLGESHPQRLWATSLLANYLATTEGWLSDRESRLGPGAVRLFNELRVAYRLAGLQDSPTALGFQRDLGLSLMTQGSHASGRQVVREVIASGFQPDDHWPATLVYLADSELHLGLTGDLGSTDGASWTIGEIRDRYGSAPALAPILLDLELRRLELLGRPARTYREQWQALARADGRDSVVDWALAQPPSTAMRAARMLLATDDIEAAEAIVTDEQLASEVRSYDSDDARRNNELLQRQHRQWDILRLQVRVVRGDQEAVIEFAAELLDRQREQAPLAFAERSAILEQLARTLPPNDPRRADCVEDGLDACRLADLADGSRPHPRLRWFREQRSR